MILIVISLDELLAIISDNINSAIMFLKEITFEFAGMTFNFWTLLLTFFVFDALILILLSKGGGKNK